jgi:hypothetical protein
MNLCLYTRVPVLLLPSLGEVWNGAVGAVSCVMDMFCLGVVSGCGNVLLGRMYLGSIPGGRGEEVRASHNKE